MSHLSWRWTLKWRLWTERCVPCWREVWAPGWKTYISTHALPECSFRALGELESNATSPLSCMHGSRVPGAIGSPWGLEHEVIGPWGFQHCSVHVARWSWCFLKLGGHWFNKSAKTSLKITHSCDGRFVCNDNDFSVLVTTKQNFCCYRK